MVFGVDDLALATLLAGGLTAGATAAGGASSAKARKKEAKESKRQTLADMYNKALERQLSQSKFSQEQGGNTAARRASLLQEMASGFSKNLTGR